ncbi:MAG: DUF2868 domain-containing protein [Pseudomonadota bacterium]
MKESIWFIKDLIDLEYFLQRDESAEDESAQESLPERDRYIYLNKILPLKKEKQTLNPPRVIRSWLEQRREIERSRSGPNTLLPGDAFDEVYGLMRFGFLIVGLLSGAGLAFSFLNYRGTEPLNISVYFAGFVLTQCLVLLFFMGMFFIRKIRCTSFGVSVIFSLVSTLIATLIGKIRHRALETLSGSKRDSLEAVMGLIRGKRQIYGSLFYWPVFILAQVFGVGFNLGVFGATLLKVLGSDIAFGWQSTVQFSAQAVFKLIQAIALPWSWFVPADIAYPTLSQIKGSHMILKDGIYHLATQDLVSWWPFLCFALLTYGLLPRLILFVIGFIAQKRALMRIDFSHTACERLVHRLTAPLFSTEGRSSDPEAIPADNARAPDAAASDRRGVLTGKDMIVLIPEDIFEACSDNEFEGIISKTFGYPIWRRLRFGKDEEGDKTVLHEISRMKREDAAPNIVILQEAWQPPIREHLRFIRDLRRALGETSMIWVGLIGRPRRGNIFTQVKEEEWKAWHQKLEALGDPYLGLERLVANDT